MEGRSRLPNRRNHNRPYESTCAATAVGTVIQAVNPSHPDEAMKIAVVLELVLVMGSPVSCWTSSKSTPGSSSLPEPPPPPPPGGSHAAADRHLPTASSTRTCARPVLVIVAGVSFSPATQQPTTSPKAMTNKLPPNTNLLDAVCRRGVLAVVHQVAAAVHSLPKLSLPR